MILFINACARKDSRTLRLAKLLLEVKNEPYTELRLYEAGLKPADEEYLDLRDRLAGEQSFEHPMFGLARQFAAADEIVIAAPYWDLSFPAVLKLYFEHINAIGVTFCYTPEGVPVGLCKAKRISYVTTAGGFFTPDVYGFEYVKALAQRFYGIPEAELIKAEGLDIEGYDAEAILKAAEEEIKSKGR